MVSTTIVFLCCFLASVLGVPVEKYTNKYDNVDMQEIISNERLLNGYTDCLLDKGPCTPDGKAIKEHISDALETNCVKCTQKQQDNVSMLINHLIKEKRNIWKEIANKYDPEGVWRKKYEEEARQKGIIIPKE